MYNKYITYNIKLLYTFFKKTTATNDAERLALVYVLVYMGLEQVIVPS